MNLKRNLLFIFFLVAGIILGALLADWARGIEGLSWLAAGTTIGLSPDKPMLLDLKIIRLAFGFELGINVAQIIMVILGFVGFKFASKKL